MSTKTGGRTITISRNAPGPYLLMVLLIFAWSIVRLVTTAPATRDWPAVLKGAPKS